MRLNVNGKLTTLADGATIVTLLGALGLSPPSVAVERNREVVPRAKYAETTLAEGDELEVVTFVGGG
jgi:sulfur carrier protein